VLDELKAFFRLHVAAYGAVRPTHERTRQTDRAELLRDHVDDRVHRRREIVLTDRLNDRILSEAFRELDRSPRRKRRRVFAELVDARTRRREVRERRHVLVAFRRCRGTFAMNSAAPAGTLQRRGVARSDLQRRPPLCARVS
jgi:hypothetical protein